jgi:hypothetical protein
MESGMFKIWLASVCAAAGAAEREVTYRGVLSNLGRNAATPVEGAP